MRLTAYELGVEAVRFRSLCESHYLEFDSYDIGEGVLTPYMPNVILESVAKIEYGLTRLRLLDGNAIDNFKLCFDQHTLRLTELWPSEERRNSIDLWHEEQKRAIAMEIPEILIEYTVIAKSEIKPESWNKYMKACEALGQNLPTPNDALFRLGFECGRVMFTLWSDYCPESMTYKTRDPAHVRTKIGGSADAVAEALADVPGIDARKLRFGTCVGIASQNVTDFHLEILNWLPMHTAPNSDIEIQESLWDYRYSIAGDTVQIQRNGKSQLSLRLSLGLRYLGKLLEMKGREIPAIELVTKYAIYRSGNIGKATDMQIAQEIGSNTFNDSQLHSKDVLIDTDYQKQIYDKIKDLDMEIAKAIDNNDIGQSDRLQVDRDNLMTEIRKSTMPGGKSKEFPTDIKKAQDSVQKAIKRAIMAISKLIPDMANHLDSSVSTGACCSYSPKSETRWKLD